MITKLMKALLCMIVTLSIVIGVSVSPTNVHAAGTNMLLNSGFDSGLTNWTDLGASAIDTKNYRSAPNSLKVGTGEGGREQYVNVTAGFQYTVSGYIKVTTGETGLIVIKWYNGSTQVGTTSTLSSTSTSWTQVSQTLTAPSNATSVRIYPYKNPNVGGYAYFDDLSLTCGSNNLVVNSGFESDLTSWSNWGNTSTVTSPVFMGLKAARIGTGEGGAGQIISGITAGATYDLSGYGSVSAMTDSAIIGVDCMDNNNTVLAKFTLSFNNTLYEFKSTTFITAPGTTKLQVYIYKNPGSGAYAYLDNISLKNKSGIQVINKDVKAMWVWDDTIYALQDSTVRSAMFQFAQDKGVNVLLICTGDETTNNFTNYTPQFKQFIADAHSRGLRVEALNGYKNWGLTAYHAGGLQKISDVINYNNSAAQNERFDGVHQDIEVYQTDLWNTDRLSCMQQTLDYLDSAMSLMSGSGMTYAQDIPRWYDDTTLSVTYGGSTKLLYQQMIDRLDWVGIMDYTDAYSAGQWQAVWDVQNEINYASTVGKKVCAGLETIDPLLAGADSVTFSEEGLDDLDRALAALKAFYDSSSGFGGVAVHCYGKADGNAYYNLQVKPLNHY